MYKTTVKKSKKGSEVLTIKVKQTKTAFTEEERTQMFKERKYDAHRVQRNKKKYTRKAKYKSAY